jgi:hypothetical protein
VSLGTPIPVRFNGDADQRLNAIAEKSGLSKAELIRIATDEFLHKVEETGEIVQRINIHQAPVRYGPPRGRGKKSQPPPAPPV